MAAEDLREVALKAVEKLHRAAHEGPNFGREDRLQMAGAYARGVLEAVAAHLAPAVAVVPPDRGHRDLTGARVVTEDPAR